MPARRVPLGNLASVSMPGVASFPTVPFIVEGSPAPIAQATLNAATLGPLSLLSVIVTATEELAQVAVESIEVVFGALLREAADQSAFFRYFSRMLIVD